VPLVCAWKLLCCCVEDSLVLLIFHELFVMFESFNLILQAFFNPGTSFFMLASVGATYLSLVLF
jgi:hypothetical protein